MLFLSCLLAAIACSRAEGPAERKRGFAGFVGGADAHWTCQDAEALGLADSWFYTWSMNPSPDNKCKTEKQAAEFVPMVNGIGQTQNFMTDAVKSMWAAANVHYLLGYNEPDSGNGKHNHPHEASPADAAADWPKVQAVAEQFDPPLELVGPAVASGGESGASDAWDADGRSTWLDEFIGNCTHVVKDCDPSKIKYIAMHDYYGDVAALKRKVEGAVKRYDGRKVWLTEVAITEWGAPPPRTAQDAFMKELLPYLDSSNDVFRYTWFSSRNAPNEQNGGSNLLPSDGDSLTPTSTGQIYASKETATLASATAKATSGGEARRLDVFV